MPDYYIEIDANGNTVNYPLSDDNLLQVFGNVSNYPSKYVPFNRLAPNAVTNVFTYPVETYGIVNGAYQDVWQYVAYSDDQIATIKTNIQTTTNNIIQTRLSKADILLDNAMTANNSNTINALTTYINNLNNFTINDYNNISIPTVPKIDANGNIIA